MTARDEDTIRVSPPVVASPTQKIGEICWHTPKTPKSALTRISPKSKVVTLQEAAKGECEELPFRHNIGHDAVTRLEYPRNRVTCPQMGNVY